MRAYCAIIGVIFAGAPPVSGPASDDMHALKAAPLSSFKTREPPCPVIAPTHASLLVQTPHSVLQNGIAREVGTGKVWTNRNAPLVSPPLTGYGRKSKDGEINWP